MTAICTLNAGRLTADVNTNRRLANTARIIGWVTDQTCTLKTLTAGRIRTTRIINAFNTRQTSTAITTEWPRRGTARVVNRVTSDTLRIDTLSVRTVPVTTTTDTSLSVCLTEGCLPLATSVVGWVTKLTGILNALLSTAIAIGATANTSGCIRRTEGRLSVAAIMVGWITENAAFFQTVGYADGGRVPTTAIVLRIALSATIRDTFRRIRVQTICISIALDTLWCASDKTTNGPLPLTTRIGR